MRNSNWPLRWKKIRRRAAFDRTAGQPRGCAASVAAGSSAGTRNSLGRVGRGMARPKFVTRSSSASKWGANSASDHSSRNSELDSVALPSISCDHASGCSRRARWSRWCIRLWLLEWSASLKSRAKHVTASMIHLGSMITKSLSFGVSYHSTALSEVKKESIAGSSRSRPPSMPGWGRPRCWAIALTALSDTHRSIAESDRRASSTRSHLRGTRCFIDGSWSAAFSIAPTSSRIVASPANPLEFSTP